MKLWYQSTLWIYIISVRLLARRASMLSQLSISFQQCNNLCSSTSPRERIRHLWHHHLLFAVLYVNMVFYIPCSFATYQNIFKFSYPLRNIGKPEEKNSWGIPKLQIIPSVCLESWRDTCLSELMHNRGTNDICQCVNQMHGKL